MATLPILNDEVEEVIEPTQSRLPRSNMSMRGEAPSVFDAPIQPAPRQDNAFQRLIRPRQDETDAANQGRRWRNAAQRDALIPGSEYAEQVRLMAAGERDPVEPREPDTSSATIRAREMQRRAMMSQYDKLISDFNSGRWNDDAEGAAAAREEGERLAQRFAEAGFDRNDLRVMPRQSASTSQLADKRMGDLYETVLDTQYLGNEFAEAIRTGKPIDVNVLDKSVQKLAATMGGDSKAMADGEKVRIQIQYLPEADKAKVLAGIARYRDTLSSIMRVGNERKWGANWNNKLNSILSDYDNNDLPRMVAGATAMWNSTEADMPTDLKTMLDAAKTQYETYMENMVFAAQIDHLAAYNTAKFLFGQAKGKLNSFYELKGSNRRFNDEFAELDEKALLGLNVKDNEFLKTPSFSMATMSKRADMGEVGDSDRAPGSNNPVPGDKKKDPPKQGEIRYKVGGRSGKR